jgi:hypothetical protein
MKRHPKTECVKQQARLTAYHLGELTAVESEAVRRHLESCDVCRSLSDDIADTLHLARGALTDPALRAHATGRLSDERRARIAEPNKFGHWERNVMLRWAAVFILAATGLFAVFLRGREHEPPTNVAARKPPAPTGARTDRSGKDAVSKGAPLPTPAVAATDRHREFLANEPRQERVQSGRGVGRSMRSAPDDGDLLAGAGFVAVREEQRRAEAVEDPSERQFSDVRRLETNGQRAVGARPAAPGAPSAVLPPAARSSLEAVGLMGTAEEQEKMAARRAVSGGLRDRSPETSVVASALVSVEAPYPIPVGAPLGVYPVLGRGPLSRSNPWLCVGLRAWAEADGKPAVRNVRVAVKFNPRRVKGWRAHGDGEFHEAADIAEVMLSNLPAGGSATLLYETVLVGPADGERGGTIEPVAEVRVRYREGESGDEREIATAVVGGAAEDDAAIPASHRLAILAAELSERESRRGNDGEAWRALAEAAEKLAKEMPDSPVAAALSRRLSEVRRGVVTDPGRNE